MTAVAANTHIIDATRAEFMLGPVAMYVAACSADHIPSVTRAFGCRIDLEAQRITLFVGVIRARSLLRDLRAGSAVAATFSRPLTHQTIQFKSRSVEVAPLRPGDRNIINAHGEAFTAELKTFDFPEAFGRALWLSAAEDALSLSFVPEDAFEQSPGAAAGQRLERIA